MENRDTNRCPVCRAAFRETTECSRCGADLAPLMTLAARARHCRRKARQAIINGEYELARTWAKVAQSMCATSAGHKIFLLAAWCASVGNDNN